MKKMITLVLTLCIAVFFFVADGENCYASTNASGQCGESMYWELDSNGVMTISGTGEMWDFRDDADFFDYHVCPWENYKSEIKQVIFEEGITYIGADAFYLCKNLKNVEFCDSLESIGHFAFFYCISLQNFDLPEGLLGLYQQCFGFCYSITELIIPDSVTFVDAEVCGGCESLTYLYIGKNVGNIIYAHDMIGSCTSLEEITVSEENHNFISIDGVLYDSSSYDLIQYPAGKKDTEYTVNENTKKVLQFAFGSARYLEKLIIPETVEYLAPCIINSAYNTIEVNILNDEIEFGENALETNNTLVRCNYNSSAWNYCASKEITHYCLEHTLRKVKTVAPTYTSQGYTIYTCDICGETIKTDYVDKLKMSTPVISKIENTSTGVKITIEAVEGATGYKIYRKTANGSWTYIAWALNGGKTYYIDESAKNGTTYIYTVRATNTNSISDYDHTGKTIKRLAQPNLTSATNTATGVSLKWSQSSGAAGYYVYRKASSTASWTRIATISGSSITSYIDKTATVGKTYIYTVKAYSGSYCSSFNSSGKTIKRLAQPTLSLANTSSGVTVKWSKVTGASGYYVYRATKSGAWSRIATISGVSNVSFVDKTAKAGTTYYYTVKAYSGSYKSSYLTAGKTIKRLTQPGVTVSKVTTGINVKWSKSTGATGYYVYRKTAGNSWVKIATIKNVSTLSYIDKTAKKGTTYYYTVKAYYGSYCSSFNSGKSIKR